MLFESYHCFVSTAVSDHVVVDEDIELCGICDEICLLLCLDSEDSCFNDAIPLQLV